MAEPLSFRSFDDVTEWLDRVEAASSVSTPNGFPAGIALAHCAQSLNLQCTGYPTMNPTAMRRTVGVVTRNRFVAKGSMTHAVSENIPGAPSIGEVSLEEGIALLRQALTDFKEHRKGMAEHYIHGTVDKITAEILQSMHIANHADHILIG